MLKRHASRSAATTSVAFLLCAAAAASGQVFDVSLARPAADRWMYPFNSTPGARPTASTFGAINEVGFDDRDAQVVIGFNTAALIPTGQPIENYRLSRLTLRVTVANDLEYAYDPTPDPVSSLYLVTDPQYTPDTDPSRPIELFATGFRGGFTAATFQENSPFSAVPTFPPQEGIRNAFAAAVAADGTLTDVSRQVEQRFDATPMAIGTTTAVSPGELVPEGTHFVFDVNLGDPGVARYLGESLAAGRLWLTVTTLQPASGGPGGPTGETTYPFFYMKENAIAQALGYEARLEIEGRVGRSADFDGSGGVDGDDIVAFFEAWQMGENSADFDESGGVDGDDITAFFVAWERG